MLVPIRAGNSNRDDLLLLLKSILNANGTALTQDEGSNIWVLANAQARAIFHIWALNEKVKYEFDPNKMNDLLERWEKILGITPSKNVSTDVHKDSNLPSVETIQYRRARIAAKFRAVSQMPNAQALEDIITAVFPNVSVTVSPTTPDVAVSSWPSGTTIVGGSAGTNAAWKSTVSNVNITIGYPAGISDANYERMKKQIYSLLVTFLPAYTTINLNRA